MNINTLSFKMGKTASRCTAGRGLYGLGAKAVNLLPGLDEGKVRNWINVSNALCSAPSKSYTPIFPSVSPLHEISMVNLIKKYNVFIFDLYGVVHMGKKADGRRFMIPGALETLNLLASIYSKNIMFMSNTADRTPAEIASDLRGMGLNWVEEGQIMTSGLVMTEYLRAAGMKKVVHLGDSGAAQYIRMAGCEPLQFDAMAFELLDDLDGIDAVVLAWRGVQEGVEPTVDAIIKEVRPLISRAMGDPASQLDVAALRDDLSRRIRRLIEVPGITEDVAISAIKLKGLPLIVPNPDELIPKKQGFIGMAPANYRRLYDWMPKTRVIELGKPNASIYEFAKARGENFFRREFKKEEMIMVGDTLDYDIKGALNFGIDSLLVLSGLYSTGSSMAIEREMLGKRLFPTFVLPSIEI